MLSVAEPDVLHTIDYVSGQGPVWLLTAALLICGSIIIYLMRRLLKEAQDGKVELKHLNEKYLTMMEKSAILMADSTSRVEGFGKQVAAALEGSSHIIENNTVAMTENTYAIERNAMERSVKLGIPMPPRRRPLMKKDE